MKVKTGFTLGIALLSMALLSTATALAQKKKGAVNASMEGVVWGSSPKQVYQHYSDELHKVYDPEIAKAIDAMTADHLRYELKQELDKMKSSYVKFDGN